MQEKLGRWTRGEWGWWVGLLSVVCALAIIGTGRTRKKDVILMWGTGIRENKLKACCHALVSRPQHGHMSARKIGEIRVT